LEFTRLLKWLAKEDREASKGARRYGKLWLSLVERQEFIHYPRVGNILQDHFLERFLNNENPFHRKAELAPLSQIGPSLSRAYLAELEALQKLLKSDWEAEYLRISGRLGKEAPPSLESARGLGGSQPPSPSLKAREAIKKTLLTSVKGNPLLDEVAGHFYQNGWGLFGRFRGFRWEDRGEGKGELVGIGAVDPIRLENLVGYDEQRRPLIENIEAFVAGKPANNVLLYGERGTGKSSTVKALLNQYQEKGLRLVEVAPQELRELHELFPHLRGRREKFILFVDDLSFEENETSYKGLKALLEGTVEATPGNVILIATSNRRHLIREFFEDRAGGFQKEGEIHGADTVEEKLSLADRFGLVISFYTPDQETFFKMVENWAKVEGIKMKPQELRARAVQWEKSNNVRSGRTARQFINDLKGKI
jgi:predicted AAA+ superfamily ATPase